MSKMNSYNQKNHKVVALNSLKKVLETVVFLSAIILLTGCPKNKPPKSPPQTRGPVGVIHDEEKTDTKKADEDGKGETSGSADASKQESETTEPRESNEVPRIAEAYTANIPEDSSKILSLAARGEWLAAGTENGYVYLLEAKTGKLVWTSGKMEQKPQSIDFSADEKNLLVTGHNLSNFIWKIRANKGKLYRSWHRKKGRRQTISYNGRMLIREDIRRSVRWYELASYKMKWLAKGRGLTASGDGKLVALQNKNGVMELRDTTAGKLEREVKGIPQKSNFALDQNGEKIIYTEQKESEWTLAVVDTKTQKQVFKSDAKKGKTKGLAVSPTKPYVTVWGDFGMVVYDIAREKLSISSKIRADKATILDNRMFLIPLTSPTQIKCFKIEIPEK